MELTNELRKKYADFIAGIDLVRINVVGINAKLNELVSMEKGQTLSARLNQTAHFRALAEDLYEITQNWQLLAVAGEKRKPLLKLSFDLAVIIRSKEKLEQDVFEIFKDNNLTLNTWPYVRELVSNITARMDLPPLTLPFFKSMRKEAKKTSKAPRS